MASRGGLGERCFHISCKFSLQLEATWERVHFITVSVLRTLRLESPHCVGQGDRFLCCCLGWWWGGGDPILSEGPEK